MRIHSCFVPALLLGLLVVATSPGAVLQAQELEWVTSANGRDVQGRGIAVDEDGNSLVTGTFRGTTVFGAGEPNETTLTTPTSDSGNMFVAKYDPSGALVWVKHAGNSDPDTAGVGITVDSDGNSYVTGYFEVMATFGEGEDNETMQTGGDSDTFVAKYAPNGALLWVAQVHGGLGAGLSIAVDAHGNSHITGVFRESAIFGEGEPNETTLASGGLEDFDIFVAKYAANGALLWAVRAGGDDVDRGWGIVVDADGNSLITGHFGIPWHILGDGRGGTAVFGAGEPNETTLISSGLDDIFVAKYAPDGALIWARRAGGGDFDSGRDISVDVDGNSLITGSFGGSGPSASPRTGAAVFGKGEPSETTAGTDDIFVAKYDPDGALLWAKRAGGPGVDRGHGITVDAEGSHLTGFYRGTAVFGEGEPNETAATAQGIFVAKYRPDGTVLWIRSAADDDESLSFIDSGNDIALDAEGNNHVTGVFYGTATFGAGEANQTTLISTGNDVDMFVAKYSASVTSDSDGDGVPDEVDFCPAIRTFIQYLDAGPE